MNNPSTSGVNGHLPGDALAAGRLPGNANWMGVFKQTEVPVRHCLVVDIKICYTGSLPVCHPKTLQ
jgi:hypothetical protein